ncbi:sugar-binding domain-containing protein [Saccharopolyspora sp. NPDC047091]|uniref:sugar-binding transcriptional regulator n=1 Tax=Saccharopolyspora sp. NPDC047091 TaxID=3155924 RepID=UPI0033C977C3
MGPERQMLAALVATKHYFEKRTKSQIAEDLALSRFQVARLLEAAHAEGIVRITVELPSGVDAGLSDRLRRHFGLKRALAVVTADDPATRRRQLGKVAADLLGDVVTEDDCLGVAWGRTLGSIPESLTRLATCPVVQLTGVAGSVSENTVELVRQVSAVNGGPASPIYAPFVVADTTTARGLRSQPGIARALELHRTVTRAVVGVGSWDPPDSKMHDSLPVEERRALLAKGVQAEVCGTLLNVQGGVVAGLEDRCIAIPADLLRQVPEVIAVGGGATKIKAMLAAIRSGLIHGLVTDATAAEELLTLG